MFVTKGFSTLVIVVTIVAVAAAYFFISSGNFQISAPAKSSAGGEVESSKPATGQSHGQLPPSAPGIPSGQFQIPGQQGCSGKGTVEFTSPPRKIEDIELIEPTGLMIGGHVTPIDHGYYYPPNWQPQDDPSKFRDVLAPADGVITSIGLVGNRPGDFRIEMYHTCTFYTIYIHVKELAPRIEKEAGAITSTNKPVEISVEAGEVIGRANSFDFSVHNSEVMLEGFIVPEHYADEPWKIHTVDMFDHFVEPIKSQLLEKNIRQAEPRGGKIDYDIDGKLVGSWFVENTNGYAGLTNKIGSYWSTHLAFAYNGIDPRQIVVSIGDFGGEAKQFAVKGNLPDPADVGVSTGQVKYELVQIDYIVEGTGANWNRASFAKGIKAIGTGGVEGAVLVQMLDDRKIKVETFPGKSASEVSGFTSAAKIYER